MDFTAALAVDLAVLSAALTGSSSDLESSLRQLAIDARAAVDSFAGFTLSIATGSGPFRLTVLEPAGAPVRSSLRIGPTAARIPAPAEFFLVLYAARAGAFVDLAADLRWLTGSDFAVDEHLELAGLPSTEGVLVMASVIDQAVGLLIGRGRTPERARDELAELAALDGLTVHSVAERLLDGSS